MDVLSHFLFAGLVLAAARVPLRLVALAAPFAVLPDLDAVFGAHRATLHSLLALGVVAVAVFAIARAARGTRASSPATLAALAAFAFVTHLALDLPTGVALAYPVTSAAPYWSLQAFHDFALGPFSLEWVLETGVLPGPPTERDPIGLSHAQGSSVLAVANFGIVAAALALAAQLAFNPAVARAFASFRARFARAAPSAEDPE